MKIATVVGARPQFIKAAAVSRALEGIEETIIHTGQHFSPEMSEVFFTEMEIPSPKYHLGIGGHSHGAMTGRMLEKLEEVLLEEKPDWVLVYGDTNSTLAGALAAVKLHIPVAHVEAGMRSYNRKMPEEINRILVDQCSELLLTPSQSSFDNLKREGYCLHKIHCVGDVMYDALLYYSHKAQKKSTIMKDLGLKERSYLLATLHRASNTDDRTALLHALEALEALADEIEILLPIHPRMKAALEREGLLQRAIQTLHVVPPAGYFDMLMLERNAQVILTDSGGVQKEAFFHQVPCLTLRKETEWGELVEMGVNRLVDADSKQIVKHYREILSQSMDWNQHPYGQGEAGRSIRDKLLSFSNC